MRPTFRIGVPWASIEMEQVCPQARCPFVLMAVAEVPARSRMFLGSPCSSFGTMRWWHRRFNGFSEGQVSIASGINVGVVVNEWCWALGGTL